MNTWIKRIGAVALAAVLALGGVSSVGAQEPDRNPASPLRVPQERVGRQLFQAVVEATGLETQDVLALLREGQTLAQVCEANAVDPQIVIDSVKTTLTAEIDQLVADGKLTEERAAQLQERLNDFLPRAMNAPLQNLPVVQHPVATQAVRELVETLAGEIDLRPAEVVQQARDGLTLAEIATAAGADPQAIVDAALAHITEHLAQQVENGRITQAQMDTLLAEAEEFLPDAMNQPLQDLVNPVRVQERLENSLIGVVAEAIGVEPADLLRDMLNPPSLAEVAEEHGLDPETLISTAETRITEAINQAVENGLMSQERADQLLSGLHDRLVERFNAPFRPVRNAGGPGLRR
jgi:polyhydroxyalkanoate synthesis regulator phasin